MPPRLLDRDLDPYSRFAVRMILERFPTWEPFAVVTSQPDGAGGAVEFVVPCPSPAVEYGLFVATFDEELTVGLHTHHVHFTNYEDRTDPCQITHGLEYAAALLEDRIGVLSWYRGGGFAGSTSIDLPRSQPLVDYLREVGGVTARPFAGCERVTLRTWSGRFDREERLA